MPMQLVVNGTLSEKLERPRYTQICEGPMA